MTEQHSPHTTIGLITQSIGDDDIAYELSSDEVTIDDFRPNVSERHTLNHSLYLSFWHVALAPIDQDFLDLMYLQLLGCSTCQFQVRVAHTAQRYHANCVFYPELRPSGVFEECQYCQ